MLIGAAAVKYVRTDSPHRTGLKNTTHDCGLKAHVPAACEREKYQADIAHTAMTTPNSAANAAGMRLANAAITRAPATVAVLVAAGVELRWPCPLQSAGVRLLSRGGWLPGRGSAFPWSASPLAYREPPYSMATNCRQHGLARVAGASPVHTNNPGSCKVRPRGGRLRCRCPSSRTSSAPHPRARSPSSSSAPLTRF